jgi:hypothetical protein
VSFVSFRRTSLRAETFPYIIAAGNEPLSNGEWSVALQGQSGGPIQLKSYWSDVNVREGDNWKIRMAYAN